MEASVSLSARGVSGGSGRTSGAPCIVAKVTSLAYRPVRGNRLALSTAWAVDVAGLPLCRFRWTCLVRVTATPAYSFRAVR